MKIRVNQDSDKFPNHFMRTSFLKRRHISAISSLVFAFSLNIVYLGANLFISNAVAQQQTSQDTHENSADIVATVHEQLTVAAQLTGASLIDPEGIIIIRKKLLESIGIANAFNVSPTEFLQKELIISSYIEELTGNSFFAQATAKNVNMAIETAKATHNKARARATTSGRNIPPFNEQAFLTTVVTNTAGMYSDDRLTNHASLKADFVLENYNLTEAQKTAIAQARDNLDMATMSQARRETAAAVRSAINSMGMDVRELDLYHLEKGVSDSAKERRGRVVMARQTQIIWEIFANSDTAKLIEKHFNVTNSEDITKVFFRGMDSNTRGALTTALQNEELTKKTTTDAVVYEILHESGMSEDAKAKALEQIRISSLSIKDFGALLEQTETILHAYENITQAMTGEGSEEMRNAERMVFNNEMEGLRYQGVDAANLSPMEQFYSEPMRGDDALHPAAINEAVKHAGGNVAVLKYHYKTQAFEGTPEEKKATIATLELEPSELIQHFGTADINTIVEQIGAKEGAITFRNAAKSKEVLESTAASGVYGIDNYMISSSKEAWKYTDARDFAASRNRKIILQTGVALTPIQLEEEIKNKVQDQNYGKDTIQETMEYIAANGPALVKSISKNDKNGKQQKKH